MVAAPQAPVVADDEQVCGPELQLVPLTRPVVQA
jgi:hypothetical protein